VADATDQRGLRLLCDPPQVMASATVTPLARNGHDRCRSGQHISSQNAVVMSLRGPWNLRSGGGTHAALRYLQSPRLASLLPISAGSLQETIDAYGLGSAFEREDSQRVCSRLMASSASFISRAQSSSETATRTLSTAEPRSLTVVE
jgi:hypothetical protein